MKKRSYAARLGVLALALTLVTTCLTGGTLAKYTTEVTGTGSATVAKWSFKANDKTGTETFTVNLADTSLNGKVADGKIAPGTDGSFTIKIDAKDSEVAVDYAIKLSDLTNAPKNLKFYSDSTFSTLIDLTATTAQITGSIALADVGVVKEVTVYWKWAYETSGADADADDTKDGVAGQNVTFKISVTGTQATPTATSAP